MIVLTKTLEDGTVAKATFEAQGKYVTITHYANGKGVSDQFVEKDEAFDMIQIMTKRGWKTGE